MVSDIISELRFEEGFSPEWIDQIIDIHNKTVMKRKHDLRLSISDGFSSSFAVITVWNGTRLIACGRMISDGQMYSGIFDVVVDPEFQKMKIGQEIMRRLIAKAPQTCIHLTSTFGNEPFYSKLGFKKHKTAMALYPNRAESPYLESTNLTFAQTTRPLPQIKTERLILRLPVLTDIPAIIQYFKENESHLSPFNPKKPDGFYTDEFWKDRIPKHTSDFLEDKGVRLYLFNIKNENEIVGSLEFSQISRGPFQACYLGYGIAMKHQGHGLMYDAADAAIRYAFRDLNIHRIMANHLLENKRSAKLLKRLGFQQECIAKDYLRINGQWRDHVLNSLHNPEWKDLL